jgi:hypothetical protein
MFKQLAMTALLAAVAVPTTAFAGQDYDHSSQWQRDQAERDRAYNDRNYRGSNRRYYQDCKRSSGTTGAVAGGVGGALLGKHLDKKHDRAENRRNGC